MDDPSGSAEVEMHPRRWPGYLFLIAAAGLLTAGGVTLSSRSIALGAAVSVGLAVGVVVLAALFVRTALILLLSRVVAGPDVCAVRTGWRPERVLSWREVKLDDRGAALAIVVGGSVVIVDARTWTGYDRWLHHVARTPQAQESCTPAARTALQRYLHEAG